MPLGTLLENQTSGQSLQPMIAVFAYYHSALKLVCNSLLSVRRQGVWDSTAEMILDCGVSKGLFLSPCNLSILFRSFFLIRTVAISAISLWSALQGILPWL